MFSDMLSRGLERVGLVEDPAVRRLFDDLAASFEPIIDELVRFVASDRYATYALLSATDGCMLGPSASEHVAEATVLSRR